MEQFKHFDKAKSVLKTPRKSGERSQYAERHRRKSPLSHLFLLLFWLLLLGCLALDSCMGYDEHGCATAVTSSITVSAATPATTKAPKKQNLAQKNRQNMAKATNTAFVISVHVLCVRINGGRAIKKLPDPKTEKKMI